MAHDVMRCADQLVLAEAADIDEIPVDKGDSAVGIRLRSRRLMVLQDVFGIGDRQVGSHCYFPFLGLVAALRSPVPPLRILPIRHCRRRLQGSSDAPAAPPWATCVSGRPAAW